MQTSDNKKPLIGLTLAQLKQVALAAGLKPFAAKQMAKWLYEKRVTDIEQMTDLSKNARNFLMEHYSVGRYAPVASAVSSDGTAKYLFQNSTDHAVETVMIPDKERATLCVSSQAGCKMNCSFCMTGKQGFHGNLTAAEIMNQILSVPESKELTNIVFMGMGEPLDNLETVMTVIEILTSDYGLGWSPKRITVSSIGKLAELHTLIENTKVHIAISLHSPFPDERRSLMPVERAYPMTEIIRLLKQYDFAHQRRLSFEYILWHNVNSDFKHAEALARLLRGMDCRVNLIRFHAIDGAESLTPATMQEAESFRDYLNSKGITATIRASRGEDIDAACGMLAGKHHNNN